MTYPPKLSHDFSGALRTFSFWVANGTVGYPLLEGIEYRPVLCKEPSLMEGAYAIFANVIELNPQGEPINAKYAEFRAAQYIRRYCQPEYEVIPPFEDWEQALHSPPPSQDPQLAPANRESQEETAMNIPTDQSDLGFTFRARKNGDVEILHHGRLASTLRGTEAVDFLQDVQDGTSGDA